MVATGSAWSAGNRKRRAVAHVLWRGRLTRRRRSLELCAPRVQIRCRFRHHLWDAHRLPRTQGLGDRGVPCRRWQSPPRVPEDFAQYTPHPVRKRHTIIHTAAHVHGRQLAGHVSLTLRACIAVTACCSDGHLHIHWHVRDGRLCARTDPCRVGAVAAGSTVASGRRRRAQPMLCNHRIDACTCVVACCVQRAVPHTYAHNTLKAAGLFVTAGSVYACMCV
jgi:hypothetical protein